jgi:hypothetical protein
MSVAAQEARVLANLLESRRGLDDPISGPAEAFLTEIQPLLEAPWAVATADFVYPKTRGERPQDFEERLQYTRALMRLAAEDYETDKLVFEVRTLLKPRSALSKPELVRRVMAMMEADAAKLDFHRHEAESRRFNLDRTGREAAPVK